jgi:hypothetical protein
MSAEFVSDRMPYITLRDHIVVLNVHSLTEDKIDDVNYSSYKKLKTRVS